MVDGTSPRSDKVYKLSITITDKLDQQESNNKAEVIDTNKQVEEKVDKLVETMSKKQILDSHYVHDCVEDAVRIKLQEDREEVDEIRKRATNIIIHGLIEPNINCSDTKNEEKSQIITILHAMKCDYVSVTDAVRLGRK